MKRGRKPKYKTKASKIAAIEKNGLKWYRKQKREAKKAGLTIAEYRRRKYNIVPQQHVDITAFNERLSKLESKVDDIMLNHEELLKDNKKFMDFMKWGKK